MPTHNNKAIQNAVVAYYSVPNDVARYVSIANTNLYSGPALECDECGESASECTCEIPFVGFTSACKRIRAWVCDEVYDLWIDLDSGCATDSGVESEEMFEPAYVSRNQIVSILIGKELSQHVA